MYQISELVCKKLEKPASFPVDAGLSVILSEDREALLALEPYLSGQKKPVSGAVIFDGQIGYMPSGAPVFADMKTAEWMAYMGMLKGMRKKEADRQAAALLAQYGLEALANRFMAKSMAPSEKRLAVMAQTMMGEPDAILLFFPAEDLAGDESKRIYEMILKMRENYPLLVLGLDPEFSAQNADALYLLAQGELLDVQGETLKEDHPELYGAVREAERREEDDLEQILADYEGGQKK